MIGFLEISSDLLLPQLGHILKGLALCFRNEFPHEYRCKDTYHTVKAVCERMAEVLAH